MRIHFLGTNGWFDNHLSNTICTLIDAKEGYFILDAGFGIHKLDRFIKEDKPVYLFISHFHMDHICGIHVLPKFNFKQGLTIFFENKNAKAFKSLAHHPMVMDIKQYNYRVKVEKIKEKKYKKPVQFETKHLHHTDTCLGYRFNLEGKIITYCSDTAVCENDKILSQAADVLIHECAYQPGFSEKIWGHSNPGEVAALAREAGVKRLFLTHFGADGYDTVAKRLNAEKVAREIFPNSTAAMSDMVVEI